MLMRISFPIQDPQMRLTDLIDEGLEKYRDVVAGAGYVPVGRPYDWEIQTNGARPDRLKTYLVGWVEVIEYTQEAA